MSQSIDWALAETVAAKMAGQEPFASSYHRHGMDEDFARFTAEAQVFVEAETGFTSLAGPARARVVDRTDWVRANLASYGRLLRPVLDQFAQGLDQATRVLVVGHTDSTGSQALNERLSLQRAQTVRDYLYSRGVPAARLEVAGRAALEPVADNATEEGRAKNRRVEIFLREPPA